MLFELNLDPKIFSWILPLLNLRHCWRLSLYAISRKTYLNANGKKTHFGRDLGPFNPNSDRQFFYFIFFQKSGFVSH